MMEEFCVEQLVRLFYHSAHIDAEGFYYTVAVHLM